MKYLGSFNDNEVGVGYDLYSINARLLKQWLTEKYTFSPLKLALFNDDTYAKSGVESLTKEEIERYNIDLVECVVKNPAFFEDSQYYYRGKLKDSLLGTVKLDDITNKQHLLGYETMPIALIVKDKDLEKREELHLLDGFRRMYYVNEIPDVDLFVKVYDKLTPAQWQSAMLLFNSWKISDKANFNLFIDRGYKFGLYTYFGIDVTTYPKDALKYFEAYINRRFYTKLKNNGLAHKELKLGADLYFKYVAEETIFVRERERESRSSNYNYLFIPLFEILGRFREVEYLTSSHGATEALTIESIEVFLQEKRMINHINKILSMSVGGFIENYVAKKVRFELVNFIRKQLGYEEIKPEYAKYVYDYSWERYINLSNVSLEAMLQEEIARAKEREIERENKKTLNFKI